MFKLTNVDLYWAFLSETNNLSGKYQVDVCNLNDAQVDKLEDEGIKVRTKEDDRGYFITCKSAKYPINAYDKNGDVINVKVANGSKADVLIKPYEWKSPTGTKGTSGGIAKLVVTDLIEYKDDAVDSIEEDSVEVL